MSQTKVWRELQEEFMTEGVYDQGIEDQRMMKQKLAILKELMSENVTLIRKCQGLEGMCYRNLKARMVPEEFKELKEWIAAKVDIAVNQEGEAQLHK